MERLVENLANGETFGRSQVDHLSFALTTRSISPADEGETKMSAHVCSAHVCVDQMEAWVAFVHFPAKVKCVYYFLFLPWYDRIDTMWLYRMYYSLRAPDAYCSV